MKPIAASIIGNIRRAALGEALQPFEQRLAQAMDGIDTDSVLDKQLDTVLEELSEALWA